MLLTVTYEVWAVAVNVVSNTAPSPKSVTVKVVFKFCVPSAAVPTCTFKAWPTLLESYTFTCILYSVFLLVVIAW